MENRHDEIIDNHFYISIQSGGTPFERGRKLLRQIVREASARLPINGRPQIVEEQTAYEGDSRAFDVPACRFVDKLIDRFTERCLDLTAVIEYEHIDPTYRDMYYNHYSHEFFDINRFTIRIGFFAESFTQEEFTIWQDDRLQHGFIGCVVIGSLNGYGSIGRTLIDPAYLIDTPVNIRLSEYPINISGHKLTVRAFPFRGQDGAMMRCAEVTLLNLMCYYSNEYSDYHLALPSEITMREQLYSNERVIPSRGLSYDKLTRILSDFRFFPRIYNVDSIGSSVNVGVNLPKEVLFRRLLHWYVSSGVPVAINVGQQNTDADGHSIICVGYEDLHEGQSENEVGNRFRVTPWIASHSLHIVGRNRKEAESNNLGRDKLHSFQLVYSSDFDRRYVMVDDGLTPYELMSYEEPSSIPGFECLNYAVPLHRGMAMDAMDAYENAIHTIADPEIGLITWGKGYFDEDETFVFDMFLTSVRGYKRDRIGYERECYLAAKQSVKMMQKRFTSKGEESTESDAMTVAEWHGTIAHTLGILAMPHFLWVVEISRLSEYRKRRGQRKVFAELVFDATSGGAGEVVDKIVLMRYPNKIYMRSPEGEGRVMPIGLGSMDKDPIRPSTENLECVSSRTK